MSVKREEARQAIDTALSELREVLKDPEARERVAVLLAQIASESRVTLAEFSRALMYVQTGYSGPGVFGVIELPLDSELMAKGGNDE